MQYAIINYLTDKKTIQNENCLAESTFEYVMVESEEKLNKIAKLGCEDLCLTENTTYTYEIHSITAEEYNEYRIRQIESGIKNLYRRLQGDDKNLTVREYDVKMRDIHEFKKALDYYLNKNDVEKQIRNTIGSEKLSLKEFDEYVKKLTAAVGTNSYPEIINELVNRIK